MGLVSHTIVFTADGLYYPPTGLRSLQVILRGAGGGAVAGASSFFVDFAMVSLAS